MATAARGALEAVLDVAVFAPLGLAVSMAEALPKLAAKGRARFVPQVGLARVVGQFAVDQAWRKAVRAAGSAAWVPEGITGWRPKAARGHADAPAATQRAAEGGARQGSGPSAPRDMEAPAGGSASAEQASSLAIPSYDSLSAPQVLQRLAGLSPEEIEAVRRYEAATRGRRTILARAEQLLSNQGP
jgi:hypothetical protein